MEESDRRFFATAAKGTETALRDELRALHFREVRADRGGVHFTGRLRFAYRACLEVRTAIRVLEELASFDAPDGNALYAGVRAVDFAPYIDPSRTLWVRTSLTSSALTHSQFVAQKVKDAVVDGMRDRHGTRPSVDREDPDLGIFVHLKKIERRSTPTCRATRSIGAATEWIASRRRSRRRSRRVFSRSQASTGRRRFSTRCVARGRSRSKPR